ncbi:histidine kinase [Knoellia sinensis KCTC 19936]|uniref:histidine kinase n=1 Tax=Knoellia sinensis KCTC 19936 TaxID=1385520 RepID=A0A0A0IZ73_9MICO|nr:sensor histidine kinase [Knoellia sinensis]KGN30063.1 histidine kinase [Knoellia sinensis KCTC 19936]
MEPPTPLSRRQYAVDIAIAALVAAVGLAEVWVPFESLQGPGSRVVDSVGILWFAAHLTQRRRRPWVGLAGLLVWPILILIAGIDGVHLLFFGQLVPVLVLTFTVAREGRGRYLWVGTLGTAAVVTLGDLTLPLLGETSEMLFHWGFLALVYLTGRGLRISADHAATEAVRAHAAESEAREKALAAVADERARIARELHDIVAHSVGTIVVQAGAAEQVVDDDPEFARKALGTIRTTGSSALAEMRRLVSVLRDPETGADFAPQPGLASLPDLVDHARESGLDVSLTVSGDHGALPAGVDLTAYRIVQEALTNVRRHSEATTADVRLDLGADRLRISVTDAGPARDGDGPAGHGLIGMRERVALYGGRVEAVPDGSGFAVRAELPLERVP